MFNHKRKRQMEQKLQTSQNISKENIQIQYTMILAPHKIGFLNGPTATLSAKIRAVNPGGPINASTT
jgi:hypothetical protein